MSTTFFCTEPVNKYGFEAVLDKEIPPVPCNVLCSKKTIFFYLYVPFSQIWQAPQRFWAVLHPRDQDIITGPPKLQLPVQGLHKMPTASQPPQADVANPTIYFQEQDTQTPCSVDTPIVMI